MIVQFFEDRTIRLHAENDDDRSVIMYGINELKLIPGLFREGKKIIYADFMLEKEEDETRKELEHLKRKVAHGCTDALCSRCDGLGEETLTDCKVLPKRQ